MSSSKPARTSASAAAGTGTGFDAVTGSLLRLNITGPSGTLSEKWGDGPHTYLGVVIAGFPNLFTITGPLRPSVVSNVIVAIEQHVEWIAELLAHAREAGVTKIEAEPAAKKDWVAHVNELADETLYPLVATSCDCGCSSIGFVRSVDAANAVGVGVFPIDAVVLDDAGESIGGTVLLTKSGHLHGATVDSRPRSFDHLRRR